MKIKDLKARRKLADNLAEYAEKNGMTTAYISKTTGCSQPAVSNYMKGATMPNLLVYRRMCKAFGVDMEYFFEGIDDDV